MTGTHITNGHLCLGRGRWQRGGVLVRDGLIVATGPDTELAALRDATTETIDAAGASVPPGFHDMHVHPSLSGIALLGIDLSPAHDAAGYHPRGDALFAGPAGRATSRDSTSPSR